MKLPTSVEGRERARLFCALRLPEETLDTLSDWQADHIARGRPVPRDHLHITLAFLGHRPVAELEPICRELREAAAAVSPMRLLPEHYREVITWHQHDGLSFAEIGERLGRTAEAARLLWWRALQHLRRVIRAIARHPGMR